MAVSAGRARPALARMSTTFVPGSSATVTLNVPPDVAARCPSTVTTADAGRTVPRSFTSAAWTTCMSVGAVTATRTGAGGGPSLPQPPASAHTAAAASGSRRFIGPLRSPLRAEALDAPAPRAARRGDLDHVARRGADQRLRHRRLGRQPPGLEVGLGRADEREGLRAPGLLVHDVDRGAEVHRVRVGGGRRDDASVAQPLREPRDPGLEMGLVLLGRVVLGILLEVAVLTRGRDPLGDRAAPLVLQPVELRLQGLEPLCRDGLSCAHRTQASSRRLGVRAGTSPGAAYRRWPPAPAPGAPAASPGGSAGVGDRVGAPAARAAPPRPAAVG